MRTKPPVRLAAAALTLLTLLAPAPPAGEDDSEQLTIATLVTVAAAVDLGFSARAAVLAVRSDAPELAASVTETALALGQVFGGEAAGLPLGITEIGSTAPALALSLHQAIGRQIYPVRSTVLSVWSGLLLVHGAAMITVAAGDDGAEVSRRPSPRHGRLLDRWTWAPLLSPGQAPTTGAALIGTF